MTDFALGTFDAASDLQQADAAIGRHGRQALAASALLLFGFFGAAAVVPVGGAVIGSGQIGVESSVKRVAHPAGGVVAQILVHEGDRVRRNQPLVGLDAAVSGTSADYAGRSLLELQAQRAALEAERDGLGQVRFPQALAGNGDPAAQAAMASSLRGFELRGQESRAMESQLVERTRQFEQQIAGHRAQIAALQRQRTLIGPERDGVRSLWERHLVTINRLNQLERTEADLQGSIAALQASIAEVQARITETRESAIALRQRRRSDAAAELARVTEALNRQQIQSASATDQYERSIIRAPADGVVDKLAISSAGDVIRPAETVMEIVPSGDELVVDAAISPADIDRVHEGQEARLRFTALDAQTTPEVGGRVIRVAAERSVEERSGAGFFRVRVAISKREVRALGLPLKPGMPAEVFVSTGARSMLSYVTRPLRDQLARAFRD